MKVKKKTEKLDIYSGATVELSTLEIGCLKSVLADYVKRHPHAYDMKAYVASLLLGSLNSIKETK